MAVEEENPENTPEAAADIKQDTNIESIPEATTENTAEVSPEAVTEPETSPEIAVEQATQTSERPQEQSGEPKDESSLKQPSDSTANVDAEVAQTEEPKESEELPRVEGEESLEAEGDESPREKADQPTEGEDIISGKTDEGFSEDEESEDSSISTISSKSTSEESGGHPLDGLTDQQLIDMVTDMEQQDRYFQMENTLFINFLKKNDPDLLESLEDIVKLVLQVREHTDCQARDSDTQSIRSSAARHTSVGSYLGLVNIASGRGPKVNLTHKTDMCMKAIEEEQSSLEAFMKKSHRIERNLRTELEEFNIRESDIKEAINIFEFNVVTQGMDKLTQRIPAEKFVRYMEEWLKSAQGQIEKLRLRIATLKIQYQKVSQQLIQRQELGENVHAVDFDQLEIENKHLETSIEQKNLHTIELKRMNGGANLVLSTHKKFLQKQQKEYNRLKEEIALKEKLISENENEIDRAESELEQAAEKYEQCKKMKTMYKVPEVIDYVRLKSQLHDLQKNIKVWSRRKKIQDIALTTCLRELKSITGSSTIDPNWFEDIISLGSERDSDSNFMLSKLR